MICTFYSNFFNHHQKPFCDAMKKLLGDGFTFVSTIEMPRQFTEAGYTEYTNTSYLLKAYESEENFHKALNLGLDSDVVIIGAAADLYVKDRIKRNRITFRYSERIFKKGDYQKFDPRLLYDLYLDHTRYRNKNLYMLCAGGFVANDFRWVRAYHNKFFKWGYFTKVNPINIDQVLLKKRKDKIKLLYVSRLIDWKHPELSVLLAEGLKNKGHDFSLEIIGSGTMETELQQLIKSKNLADKVTFIGNLPNEAVLKKMISSHIFIFTSDQNEGWGAVANEAMAHGCALVVSHKIGAAPFLIEHAHNGLVFESGNLNDLVEKTELLINDSSFRENLARLAYRTISKIWSPENAARNFMNLVKGLLANKAVLASEGPCSRAKPLKQKWYK